MNAAKVIQFPKTDPQPKQEAGKNMYSDKFDSGYVMSSRLYRKEVFPFLSDAARNVYAELENRINGHNKESDFVSYSQLQGGELEGSRKLGSKTITVGVKELLDLGVISVVGTGKQGVKKYRLNEVSLINHFTNESTSLRKVVDESTSLSSVDHFTNESDSTSLGKVTIDNKNFIDIKKKKVAVDNSVLEMFSSSVEYQGKDNTRYSLRELANVYVIKTDFSEQAKKLKPELTDELIFSELRNFAQWSTGREPTTAQGWMNYWIYRIQNLSAPKTTSRRTRASKNLTDSQINLFSKKLCELPDFACTYANTGESQKNFESRISTKLRNPEQLKHWASYLRDVGFVGEIS